MDTTTLGEVAQALEAIPNVDNVHINISPDIAKITIEPDREPGSIQDGPDYTPHFGGESFELQFTVHIPFKIQAELAKSYELRPLYTEKFLVFMHYGYFGPGTFIVPTDPTQRPEPSDGVITVREFLTDEFEKLGDIPACGPGRFSPTSSADVLPRY
jgi:hypothetical protein